MSSVPQCTQFHLSSAHTLWAYRYIVTSFDQEMPLHAGERGVKVEIALV